MQHSKFDKIPYYLINHAKQDADKSVYLQFQLDQNLSLLAQKSYMSKSSLKRILS